MKAIEKVAVTPVQVNDGAIIDSFETQDNKHKNAPSIHAVEQKISDLNGTLGTIEGNITTLDTGKQNKVLSGTGEPSSSLGNNGDVYFQYNA